MNQFYVSTVIIGIMFIIISLVLVAFDRKKSLDYASRLDEKKEELTGIIADADQMIDEMNKFSDYIVTQMELKNEEMSTNLKLMEEKISHVNSTIPEVIETEVSLRDKVVNGSIVEPEYNRDHYTAQAHMGVRYDSTKMGVVNVGSVAGYKTQTKSKDKVVPINNKANTVIQMARNGLSETEIAKSLKMGKGEIQLILEMNK